MKSGVRRRAEEQIHSSSKRGRVEFTPTREKGHTKEVTSHDTQEMEFTCPESSALLHTPLVMRVARPVARETQTPHSILKGRSTVNTLGSPATVEKSISSMNRQIRFSFPKESSSQSPPISAMEDEEQFSPTVSPRKSIHQASSVKERKGTPANPRILRNSLRNAAVQLQFDDDDETNTREARQEISATAATLLRNISSHPVSSETAKSPLYSSPSQNTRSKSNMSFKLPYGLDGNLTSIEEMEVISTQEKCNIQTDEEISSNEESYYSIQSSSSSRDLLSRDNGSSLQSPNDISFTEKSKSAKHIKEGILKTDNVEDRDTNQDEDVTLTSLQEADKSVDELDPQSSFSSLKGGVTPMIVSTKLVSYIGTPEDEFRTSTPTGSLQNNEKELVKPLIPQFTTEYSDDPKSPEEIKIIVQGIGIGTSSFSKKTGVKLVDYNVTGDSIIENEPSLEQDVEISSNEDSKANLDSSVSYSGKTTFNWTTENNTGSLQMEVNKNDSKGNGTCVAKVTLSEGMQMFYSEPKEEIVKDVRCEMSNKQTELVYMRAVSEMSTKEDHNSTKNTTEISCKEEEILSNKNILLSDTSLNITESKELEENLEEATFPEASKMPSIKIPPYQINENLNETEFSLNMPDDESLNEPETSRRVPEKSPVTDVPVESEESLDLNTPQIVVTDIFSFKEARDNEETAIVIATADPVIEYGSEPSGIGNCTDIELRLSDVEDNQGVDNNQVPEESNHFAELEVETLKPLECVSDEQNDDYKLHRAEGRGGRDSEDTVGKETGIANVLADSVIEYGSEPNELEGTGNCTDFELRMSDEEDDQGVDNNEVPEESNSCAELVFETLKPVECVADEQNEEYKLQEEEYEEEYQYEDDDADIYGDLDEGRNEETYPKSYKQPSSEDGNEKTGSSDIDVVCLSSESEEEIPKKAFKTSTPYRKIPEADMYSEGKSDEAHSSDTSESSNTPDDGDELSSYSSSSSSRSLHLSDSDSELHHGNRSWKAQRKSEISNKDKSCSDDDKSIESTFEMVEKENYAGTGSVINSKQSGANADTVVESSDITEFVSSSIKDNKVSMDEHSAHVESSSPGPVGCLEPCANSGENPPLDSIEINPAENKRKECVETGSLLDLKNRRSKRYSSAGDLSFHKDKRSRRRSCSMHDLTSFIISDAISARRNCLKNLDQPSFSGNSIDTNLPEVCEDSVSKISLPMETDSEMAQCLRAASDSELSEINIKDSSLVAEPWGESSSKLSMASGILETGKVPEYLKRQSKVLTGRFMCNLQNISEEMSAEHGILQNFDETKRSLRKSLSSNQLAECSFVEDSLHQRSSSKKWHEFTQAAGESEIVECNEGKKPVGKENTGENISPKQISSSIACVDEDTKNREDDLEVNNGSINLTKSSNTHHTSTAVEDEHGYEEDYNISYVDEEINNIKRKARASSEPSYSGESEILQGMTTRRKSTSLLKVESIHNRLFSRPFKRRSTRESLYKSLVVVDSDDSFNESSKPKVKQAKPSSKSIDIEDNQGNNGSNEHLLEMEGKCSVKENAVDSHLEQDLLSEVDRDSLANLSKDPSTSKRSSRGTSEPPSYLTIDHTKTKRRSSSLHKLDQFNKLIFARSNLRKSRSTRSSCFKNLEVVHSSDEEKSAMDLGAPNEGRDKLDAIDDDNDVENSLAHHIITKKHIRKDDTAIETTSTNPAQSSMEVNSGESIFDASATKYPQPPKKRGRPKKAIEQVYHAVQREGSTEGMKIDSDDTEMNKIPKKRGKKLQLPSQENIIENTTNKKTTEVKNINNKLLAVSSKSDEDDTAGSECSEQRNPDEPEHQTSVSKKKPVKRRTYKNIKVPPTKNTEGKTAADRNKTVKKVGKNQLEEHQLNQIAVEETTIVKEPAIKQTGGKSKLKQNYEQQVVEEQNTTVEGELNVLTPIKTKLVRKKKKASVVLDISTLDSPARRTRRSVSRMSDTELLASPLLDGAKKKRQRSRAMSDIVLSSPAKTTYSESESSEVASTSSRLATPTRRSSRRHSTSSPTTPRTPELKPDDYLMQRRLTRNQHCLLQKSFESSLTETPRLPKLEDLPEEMEESEGESSETNLTPVRKSIRNASKRPLNYPHTKTGKTTPKK